MKGLRLNLEPIYPPPVPMLVPEPYYPAPEYNFDPMYLSNYPLAPVDDPKPEYHPGPEYLDEHLYDPAPSDAEPLNVAYPLVLGSLDSSHHSSMGDNFDYPEIRDLDNDSDANSDDLQYVLNNNSVLTQSLHLDLLYAR